MLPQLFTSGQSESRKRHTCVTKQTKHNIINMVRKLKFHEKKLLKKVDFISWNVDNNIHELKVMKKYYIQRREDYTK